LLVFLGAPNAPHRRAVDALTNLFPLPYWAPAFQRMPDFFPSLDFSSLDATALPGNRSVHDARLHRRARVIPAQAGIQPREAQSEKTGPRLSPG
jgi:hypothetical protein